MNAGSSKDGGPQRLEPRSASVEAVARMSLEALLYYVLAGAGKMRGEAYEF